MKATASTSSRAFRSGNEMVTAMVSARADRVPRAVEHDRPDQIRQVTGIALNAYNRSPLFPTSRR